MSYPALKRVYMAYLADDNQTYEIGTSFENAQLMGATICSPGTFPSLPKGWEPRHICGVEQTTGKSTKVPVPSPGSSQWVEKGGSFTKGGGTYNALGRIGERRIFRGGGPLPS